jgi:hypothetical protein
MIRAVLILYFAIIFTIVETAYFGWNMRPQSNAEIICDAISVGLCIWGVSEIRYQLKIRKYNCHEKNT